MTLERGRDWEKGEGKKGKKGREEVGAEKGASAGSNVQRGYGFTNNLLMIGVSASGRTLMRTYVRCYNILILGRAIRPRPNRRASWGPGVVIFILNRSY